MFRLFLYHNFALGNETQAAPCEWISTEKENKIIIKVSLGFTFSGKGVGRQEFK